MLTAPDLVPSSDLLPGDSATSGPQVFKAQITDLYGTVLTWTDALGITHEWIEQFTNVSVDLTINDDRAASVTLSLYHPAVALISFTNAKGDLIGTLGRMLRITYRDQTIFWGLIVNPKASTQSGTVTLGCQGPTYKLRHRQLNYGDSVTSPEDGATVQNPSDHTTIKKIVEAAYDTPSQYAENIPDIGVQVVNVSGVDAPDGFWTEIERGSNNWDKLQEVCESAYGGEFDVVPHDPSPDELPFDTTLVPVPVP